jgi:predicted nucleic acid-binding protein
MKDNITILQLNFLLEIFKKGNNKAVPDIIDEMLATLSPREVLVLKLRYGLEDEKTRTLAAVGRELMLTRERVRQIEAKAFRKLRHSSRLKVLFPQLEITYIYYQTQIDQLEDKIKILMGRKICRERLNKYENA